MKYTFLLPAYKARFFEEALCSILSQTYTNFNVIVSDDCSPVDLKSIVDKFADPRVTYRRNEKNIGAEHLVDHWNMLLGLTDAEYVIMASDDDVYDVQFLEKMERLSNKYHDANVLRPMIRRIDANGNEFFRETHYEPTLGLEQFIDLWSKESICSGIPYYVFKRVPFVNNGGFPNYPYAWFSDDGAVIKSIINGGYIAMTNQILFSFRSSGINISDSESSKISKKQIIAALMFDGQYLSNPAIDKNIAKIARQKVYWMILFALKNIDNKTSSFKKLLLINMPNRQAKKAKSRLLLTICLNHFCSGRLLS